MNQTPFDQFISLIVQNYDAVSVWGIAKILYLIAFMLYIAFSVVVARQVKMMNQTVEVSLNTVLILIAYVHVVVALGSFLLALLIL